jgi:hypothetical protein
MHSLASDFARLSTDPAARMHTLIFACDCAGGGVGGAAAMASGFGKLVTDSQRARVTLELWARVGQARAQSNEHAAPEMREPNVASRAATFVPSPVARSPRLPSACLLHRTTQRDDGQTSCAGRHRQSTSPRTGGGGSGADLAQIDGKTAVHDALWTLDAPNCGGRAAPTGDWQPRGLSASDPRLASSDLGLSKHVWFGSIRLQRRRGVIATGALDGCTCLSQFPRCFEI